ncbi:MAG: transcription termination factor Rho [Opitutales bacterium]
MSETATQDPRISVAGIFEPQQNNNGQLLDPSRNGRPRRSDPFVPRELIRRFKLQRGSWVVGNAQHDDRFSNPKLRFIESIDGVPVEERKKGYDFKQLTTTSPDEQLKLEHPDGRLTTRVMDLFTPVGKGTRGLIVAPPRTGKTTILKDVAEGVLHNHPEAHVIVLLVDERPEEVTDFKRDLAGAEVLASSNDEELPSHLRIADLAIDRAKRLVEVGRDVVLLMDSLTRLARAHNANSSTGRTMTGGLDVRALEKPRQIFSSARQTEEGGSLTILASALVETGSRMDDLIFQEFKGTGNMEVVLDRKCAELRLWPALNVNASGTRREELILPKDVLEKVSFFRRALAPMKPIDACETLIERLGSTTSNEEFLRLLKV